MTCRNIDIRRLTLFQLYLAQNKSWCILQEQLVKGNKYKPAILAYTEECFQYLLTVIWTSQTFADVNDNPYRLSALMVRTNKALLENP